MSTTKDKVEFLRKSTEVMGDYSRSLETRHEEMMGIASEINVSSIYVVANKMGEITSYISDNFRKINNKKLECLEVYKNNKDNVGDYKTLVNNAISEIESYHRPAYIYEKMDIQADGDENVTQPNITALTDILSIFAKDTRTTLMEISTLATKMKNDKDAIIVNIGKSTESVTNQVIVFNKELIEEVEKFAQRYNLELNVLSELTQSISRIIEDFDEDANIVAEDYEC